MIDAATANDSDSPGQAGYIGRIPVRNLWLLMLYASNLFQQIGTDKLAVEDNPDDIPDLIAEILAHAVDLRIVRNLGSGYQSREAVLGRVRGRIDLLQTERYQWLERGRVVCRFDELTVNTPRNRFVRAALDKIAKITRPETARRCRSLAGTLRRMGVTGQPPDRSYISVDRFGRHDVDDQQMVAAAQLAFDMALPTETSGTNQLPVPDREVTWIRDLYQRGVGGFYKVALRGSGWRVAEEKTIQWSIEHQTAGIQKILPAMRMDIVLDNAHLGKRIVIDTKFTSILTRGWYREEAIRSGYLYQIYAYLRSQERNGDPLSDIASGLLLHPSVGDMVDEKVVIQGHKIRFATVDLAAKAAEIRRQLLHVVGVVEDS